jgi:hypothetical protein
MARIRAGGLECGGIMARCSGSGPRAGVSPPSDAAAAGEKKRMAGFVRGPARRRAAGLVAATLAAALLAGCAENGDMMRAVGWFNRAMPGIPQKTVLVLPDTPDALGTEGMEGSLRNAMELAKAKRFAEAREIMAGLAGGLPPDSDLWRSVKCSEMVLALRGNDLAALLESAEAVERNLRDPLRPPVECVSQLSIASALRGRPLPLNAPDSLATALQSVPRPREVRAAGSAAVTR